MDIIERLHIGELILVTAGVFFLVSTIVVAGGGSFTFNIVAKAFYIIGVAFFLITQ